MSITKSTKSIIYYKSISCLSTGRRYTHKSPYIMPVIMPPIEAIRYHCTTSSQFITNSYIYEKRKRPLKKEWERSTTQSNHKLIVRLLQSCFILLSKILIIKYIEKRKIMKEPKITKSSRPIGTVAYTPVAVVVTPSIIILFYADFHTYCKHDTEQSQRLFPYQHSLIFA